MKKFLVLLIPILSLCLFGCSKKDEENILKKFSNKVSDSKSYYLTGTLEMMNNENCYKYDVNVSYTKKNNFKVSLKNQSNDHEQIILRNNEGVYVITPSLNKSFKFQSEWPYNNSQTYLLQIILDDLENDDDRTYVAEDSNHIYTSKVNYSNNSDLVKQRVTLNDNGDIQTVEVLDSNDVVRIKMSFNDIDYNAKFANDYYELEKNVSVVEESTSKTSKIEDAIYPMYIPVNTSLSSQETISTNNGERVIMTFEGDSPFMLVQENADIPTDFTTLPINGDLAVIGDSIGIVDDTSATWYSNNVEYYLVSPTLSNEQLLEVARSIGSIPVIK